MAKNKLAQAVASVGGDGSYQLAQAAAEKRTIAENLNHEQERAEKNLAEIHARRAKAIELGIMGMNMKTVVETAGYYVF